MRSTSFSIIKNGCKGEKMKIKPFIYAGILAAGIGAANLSAAECNVTHHQGSGGSTDAYLGYPATALYLFEGNYLDLSKMNLREPAVKNASSTMGVQVSFGLHHDRDCHRKGGQGGTRCLFR